MTQKFGVPGPVVQLVVSLSADQGVTSLIPTRSHTFVDIDYENIISTVILLPSADSRRVVVSYKRKYECVQSTGKLHSQACQGKKCS